MRSLARTRWLAAPLLTLVALVSTACGARSSAPSAPAPAAKPAAQASAAKPAPAPAAPARVFEVKIGLAAAGDATEEIGNIYAKVLNEAGKGQLQAKVYPGSQLGDNTQMMQAIQAGTLEVTIQPVGFMGPFLPEAGALSLPFLFRNLDEQAKVLNSPAMDEFGKVAAAKGFLMSYYPMGFINMVTRKPMNSLEDLKGLKIRVLPTPELQGQFKAWGANGVPVNLAELYTALQQGTVDGFDNPADITFRMKHYEVAPYYTLTGHNSHTGAVVVSKVWLDRLPKDLQTIILETGPKKSGEFTEIIRKAQNASLDGMRAQPKVTVKDLPAAEIEKMRKAVEPVWDEDRNHATKGPITKALEAELARLRK